VIVENGGHGSSVAAPIARKVLDAYLLNTESEVASVNQATTDASNSSSGN